MDLLNFCRACANICVQSYIITSKICDFSTTFKDMMILLVPQMGTELDDNDFICNNCRETLIHCARFIDKCLHVEANRKENISSQNSLDIDPRIIFEDVVIKMEEHNLSDVDQEDTNNTCLDGDFEVVNIKIENNHGIDDTQNDLVAESIPNHNTFISAQQICEGKLNEFIRILSSNDVRTIQLSGDSGRTTEKKRVILFGSTLKCKKCYKYFSSAGKYARHLEAHGKIEQRPEDPKRLRKLGVQKFEERKARRRRTRMNGPGKRGPKKKPVDLECKTCSEKFSSTDELELHLKVHPPFVCEKCGKGFATRTQICAHKYVHKEPNSFVCEVCGKGFKTNSQLRNHALRHENTAHACKKCPKVFIGVVRLKDHMKMSHGEGQTRIWTCKECGKVFKRSCLYQTHYRQIHLRDGNKKCDVCGQGFHRTDYLVRHRRRHIVYGETRESLNNDAAKNGAENDIKKRCKLLPPGRLGSKWRIGRLLPGPFQCQICMKYYKNIDNLKRHIFSHGKARFNCKSCSRTFKIKYLLNRHENLHHKPDSSVKYRCEICWKRFEVQEDLDLHYIIHTNSKHKCELCEESFAREHLLNDHMANVHGVLANDDDEEELTTLMKKGLGTTLYNSINI